MAEQDILNNELDGLVSRAVGMESKCPREWLYIRNLKALDSSISWEDYESAISLGIGPGFTCYIRVREIERQQTLRIKRLYNWTLIIKFRR